MGMITQEAYFRQRVLNYAAKHGVTAAAIQCHMSRKTVHKWKKRYDGTVESLQDLPRTPHHFPRQQTSAELKLVKRYANLWVFAWYMYSCWEYSVQITRSIALLCGYLETHPNKSKSWISKAFARKPRLFFSYSNAGWICIPPIPSAVFTPMPAYGAKQ